MTQSTYSTARTLNTVTVVINVSYENEAVQVDQPNRVIHRKNTVRVVWRAPADLQFALDFHDGDLSPGPDHKFWYDAKFDVDEDVWEVAVILRNPAYKLVLKYDVVTDFGTLDPALIIDPN